MPIIARVSSLSRIFKINFEISRKGNCLDLSPNLLIGGIKNDCPKKNAIWTKIKKFFDLTKNKNKAIAVIKEKNNFALKIIPELKRLAARFGISGSSIKFNQTFEKKNAIDKPNKINILKLNV